MTARDRLMWQAAAVVWTVGPMAVLGGGRYPWWADACVYVSTGLMVATLTGEAIDRREARAEAADGPHPCDCGALGSDGEQTRPHGLDCATRFPQSPEA